MKRIYLLFALIFLTISGISAQTSTDSKPGIRYKNNTLTIGTPFDHAHFNLAINDLGEFDLSLNDSLYSFLRIKLANSGKAFINGGGINGYGIMFQNPKTKVYNPLRVGWVLTSSPNIDIPDEPDPVQTNIISSLEPVSYKFKAGHATDNKRHLGFIAQDMEKVVPELVTTTSDGLKAIDVYSLIPLLVASVNELKGELDADGAALENLRAEMKESGYHQILFEGDSRGDNLRFRHFVTDNPVTISLTGTAGDSYGSKHLPAGESTATFMRAGMPRGIYVATLAVDGDLVDSISFSVE